MFPFVRRGRDKGGAAGKTFLRRVQPAGKGEYLTRIVDAAKESNTSVMDYLNMPIGLFVSIWVAICDVNRRRAEEMKRIRNGR